MHRLKTGYSSLDDIDVPVTPLNTVLGEWRKDFGNKAKTPTLFDKRSRSNGNSDNLVSFPTGRLWMSQILCGVRLLRVAILACIWIGVFLLVKVTEGVVDFSMLALIGANYFGVSREQS